MPGIASRIHCGRGTKATVIDGLAVGIRGAVSWRIRVVSVGVSVWWVFRSACDAGCCGWSLFLFCWTVSATCDASRRLRRGVLVVRDARISRR